MIRFTIIVFYKSVLPDSESCLLIMIFIIKDEPGLDFWKAQTIQPLPMTQHPMLLFYTSTAVITIRKIHRKNKVKHKKMQKTANLR